MTTDETSVAIEPEGQEVLSTRGLSVFAGSKPVLRAINLEIASRQVFGIIGPSGVGKSTLLRCFNRMIELVPNLRVEGEAYFQGRSIRDPRLDVDRLRARIGMLFQQPVVFPRSVYDNVLFGVRHLRHAPKSDWPGIAERALRETALWPEVKDRLRESGLRLSVGQQQRLCLARALAVNPEVILMDEPTSALDPRSTEAIEHFILNLARTRTVVLVTHNMRQARRIAGRVALLNLVDGAGQIVDCASCDEVLERHANLLLD